MEHETTTGLTPRKLAQLLALGAEQAPPASEREALARLLDRPIESEAATTLGQLLLDDAASVESLDFARRLAKRLAREASTEPERAAATAVYFAAIARGLLAGRSITRQPHEQLRQSLADLESRPWMTPELRELFARAGLVKG